MRTLICLAILTVAVANATVPSTVNYQGRLTDITGAPVDTTVDLTFRIYKNLTGGSASWSETQTSITVADGLFDVRLGSVNNIDHIFTGPTLYLTVQVGAGPESDPRQPMVSVPFSIQSLRADTAEYAVAAGSTPSSVWEQTTSTVYLPDITDKVGIGTTNPVERLHVVGNLRLENSFGIQFGIGDTKVRAAGDDLEVVGQDDLFLQANDKIFIGQFGEPVQSIIDPVSMKVGFGTTNPEEILHLYNEASGGRAFLKIQANHPTNWHETGIRIETPQNRWHWRMDDDLNNNMNPGAISLRSQNGSIEAMTWEENGFVGIGTANPQQRLHVNGKAIVSSMLGINNTSPNDALDVVGDAQVTGDINAGGDVDVTGALTAGSITGNYAANSINNTDILDEVGLASIRASNWIGLTTSWTPYLTREITVPAAGYILAVGRATIYTDHGASGSTLSSVAISDQPNAIEAETCSSEGYSSNVGAGRYYCTIPVQMLFHTPSAGTYTYYMVARKGDDNSAEIYNRQLDLLYIPTGYSSKGIEEATSTGSYSSEVSDLEKHMAMMDASTETNDGSVDQRLSAMSAELEMLKQRLAELESK